MSDTNHERTLALPGGRTLEYTTVGDASSTTVVLYLHGSFSIGQDYRVSPEIAPKHIHHVCPTLPGWGNTSPPPPLTPYVDCLLNDMTTLLDHLYPDLARATITLYVAGGSFGTVPAQMLYGAPYDRFPYGRRIAGVLLMGSLAPLRYYRDYARHMTWSNYVLAGPVSQWLPWPLKRVFVRLVTAALARKVSTVERADKFVREFIFDKMDAAEKEAYAQWRARNGIAEGETERRFATNIVRSVAKSWEGFMMSPDILHSDWGFRPDALDEEHSRPPVMLVTGTEDKEAPKAWTEYLANTYKNTKVKVMHGGHTSVLYYMDEIWGEFLANVE